MPLIELLCKKCGLIEEELVKADGKYPVCPACGGKRQQKFSGTTMPYISKNGRGGSSGCSGCQKGNCGGCNHSGN